MSNLQVKESTTNNLRVITAINFTSSALKAIGGTTFLYDPNWSAKQKAFNGLSLPISFIEVIKDDIVQQNDVSSKRIVLYEPGATAKEVGNMFRPSVMNIAADNIVTKPMQHKIECLVPYGFVTKVFTKVENAIEAVANVFSTVSGKSTSIIPGSVIASIKAALSPLTTLVDMASNFTPYSFASYNVNSILAMSRNRSVLMYKSWDSWDFKYVVISNVIFSKIGTEDDYMRCSMEIQEVPILSIGSTPPTAQKADKSGIFIKTLKASIQALNTDKSGVITG